MNRATQLDFEKLVAKYYQTIGSSFKLAALTFEEDGFIATARLAGARGQYTR